jgi:hypothetical protein
MLVLLWTGTSQILFLLASLLVPLPDNNSQDYISEIRASPISRHQNSILPPQ